MFRYDYETHRCLVPACKFYEWMRTEENKGLIILLQPDDRQSPLHSIYCMDRPHITYCEKTEKYVAWLKIMAGEVSQFMSVM